MNKFGFSLEINNRIIALFSQNKSIKKVFIFGSRALGTYRDNSDVDFAVLGDFHKYGLGKLKLSLEELNTPFLFDVLDFDNINSLELKEYLKKDGILFYENS